MKKLLPCLMKNAGLDMWVIVSREDSQDPVITTLLPPALNGDGAMVFPPTCSRIILVISLTEQGIRYQQISALNYREYENVWDSGKEGQWECLVRIVRESNPAGIGIDISDDFPHADGLSATDYRQLVAGLGEFSSRLVSAEKLVVNWLEIRLEDELMAYKEIIEMSNAIIAEAFCAEGITPGETSVDDLSWYMRQRIRDLNLTAWFKPTVAINRQGQEDMEYSGIIQPGDLVFCDLGLSYLGLTTDAQQQAYVLKPGEKQAPVGLVQAIRACNRLQDIVTAEFAVGRSGNEILSSALAQAKAEGIKGYISTHPLGFFGHGPGAPIGVWDKQDGVPGRGDYPLQDNTCYALELCTVQQIPEWGNQWLTLNLEETIIFSEGKVMFSPNRRTGFHLIGR